MWCMTLSVQILCTTLIVLKIWFDTRQSRAAGSNSSRPMAVVWTIVESGALYGLTTIFLLTLFLLKTQAGAIIGDPLGQISVCFLSTFDYVVRL
jgi:hypothetical protein